MSVDVTSYVIVAAPTTGTATAVPPLHAAPASALLLWTPYHGSTVYQGTRASYIIAVPAERTGAGPDWQLPGGPSETTREAILEIRRRAGLTWEELADLFDVSRRSVHHWANGKAVTADHEQRI